MLRSVGIGRLLALFRFIDGFNLAAYPYRKSRKTRKTQMRCFGFSS